jgi:alpha-beta hydrolase superfamily lysophospholipase
LPGPPPFNYKKAYPTEGEFKYKDWKLHYYANEPTTTPKAILFSFHGMGGHSLFGGYFANTICEQVQDLNVYAVDQLNFGKSEGPYRGLITSLADNVE